MDDDGYGLCSGLQQLTFPGPQMTHQSHVSLLYIFHLSMLQARSSCAPGLCIDDVKSGAKYPTSSEADDGGKSPVKRKETPFSYPFSTWSIDTHQIDLQKCLSITLVCVLSPALPISDNFAATARSMVGKIPGTCCFHHRDRGAC